MNTHYISSQRLTSDVLEEILENRSRLGLSVEASTKINRCREYLDRKIASGSEPIYGINTGFGSLCNVKIEDDQLGMLQKNLVMSHACGMGEEVPPEIVRLMLFLKIQSLAYGHSGIALETVQRLIAFYNEDILPVIYTQGSLGASGDLAPLAHLSLPLLGLGEVNYQGRKQDAASVIQQFNWSPLQLRSKEGLALLNGTQFMSAYGIHCLIRARQLCRAADTVAAISLDAFDCRIDPFNKLIHQVRPHPGQLETAGHILALLAGSKIADQPKKQVQDPYSFRCIPQVHGASKDVIRSIESVFMTEVNSVTDNPNIFPEEDQILSGGNFHGQPLALNLDFLCIAVSELGSISERRIFQLISGQRGLPPFLVSEPGLNSGLMIPQYTAAGIASENKQLCTPASVDSIVSSNGQEDHVSMGANAAVKALKVIRNTTRIIGIELFTATQALEFRKPLKSSKKITELVDTYRLEIAPVGEDRVLAYDLTKSENFILNSFKR